MLSYTDPAVSIAQADACAVLRGWTNWSGLDAVNNAAIRRGQGAIAASAMAAVHRNGAMTLSPKG